MLPPSRHQLTFLLRFAPLVVAQVAAVLLALCGLVLLALAPGLRRGQRQAWVLAVGTLLVAAVLHLARGIDAVQCGLSLALVAVLVARRGAFVASAERRARRSGALLLLGGLLATIVTSTRRSRSSSPSTATGAAFPSTTRCLGVAERMVGVQTVAFPARAQPVPRAHAARRRAWRWRCARCS